MDAATIIRGGDCITHSAIVDVSAQSLAPSQSPLAVQTPSRTTTTTMTMTSTSTTKVRRKPGKKLIVNDVPDDQLDPDELRKRRNRIKSMRSYYSRKANVEGLAQQVAQLEKEYARKLEEKNAAMQQQQPLLSLDSFLAHPEQVLDAHALHNVLSKLSNLRRDLYQEHQLLKDQIREHMKAQGRIGVLIDELRKESAESEQQRVLIKLKQPLSVDECFEFGREAYRTISKFLEEKECLPLVDQVVAYDWRLRNYKDGAMLRYLVDKRFQFYTGVDLMARAWSTVRTKEKWEQLFSRSINIHFFELQVINDDNVVLARTNDRSDHGVSFKSVFLLTRFEIHPHAFMVVLRGLDQDRVECDMREGDKWWNIFSWFVIEEEIVDGHMTGVCTFTFGGAKPMFVGARLEALLMMLRWESMAISPLILLPSEDDADDSDLTSWMSSPLSTSLSTPPYPSSPASPSASPLSPLPSPLLLSSPSSTGSVASSCWSSPISTPSPFLTPSPLTS